MNIKDPDQLWKTALAQLEIKIDNPAQYKTFFQGTRLVKMNEGRATISVANAYMSDWLQQKYGGLIKETVSHVYGEPLDLDYRIDPDYAQGQAAKLSKNELLSSKNTEPKPDDGLLSMQGGMHRSVSEAIKRSGLNEKYTMKNYIVGDPNQFAHAAAQAVIDNPGQIYNPLFIHGSTGVGKTHLAQAVARAIIERNPKKKVVYTPSEGFLNDMVWSLRNNKQFEFRNRYRSVDILILDDIQLISKWVKTQDEFFNTFNELYESHAHVILVSDRPPAEIKELQDRLRSRFQGGIVVDIQVPNFEMRLAILHHMNSQFGYSLRPEQMEIIAKEVEDNIRELEGCMQKVALFNQIKPGGGTLSLDEVNKIIGSDPDSRREKIKVSEVIKQTAKQFGVTVKDLKGSRRTKDVALARQVAMYLLREEFEYNLEEIAGFVNRKDHTTVIHAVDKVKSLVSTEDGFKSQVVKVIRVLNENASED